MSWRERNAPYGLQQLAYRFGTTVDHLLTRPDVIAAAIGTMEGGQRGARHVAESFLDFVDRNGGGKEGILKAIPHYDTMVMTNPRQIGNLASAQNMTIAGLNPEHMKPTIAHVQAVQSGQTPRVLPEGYTKNFAAPYPGIPGGGQNYRRVQAPDGSVHNVPYWATESVSAGRFTRSPSGEYLVPENGQQPFQVSWSSATAHPGMAPVTPPGNVYASGQPIPPGHNPISTIPEGRMALGAPIQPEAPAIPGPVTSQPLPPVTVTAPQPPVWTGEGDTVNPPPPDWQAKTSTTQPTGWVQSMGDAPDPAGDAIIRQAKESNYNNKVTPPMAPSVGPSPSFQQSPFDAGAFFKAFDGSGFKDGGAVKSSKPTAQYRGHPNRGDKCRDCTMFVAPHGCTAVRGAISPYGWCKYFEATPTSVAQAIKKAATQVERNPTELQKEWGNYSMGHFNWKGLEITLENPKGSIRRGKGWEVKMPAGYGYIKKTLGKDGDHVDVYVGDDHASDKVFVIDQVDAATGKFDEHKCMLSMPSKAVAIATYNKGFSDGKGPDRMGAVSELPVEKFKAWLEKGDTKKPMGKIVKRRAEGGRVQDLDALSSGLPTDITDAEVARAKALREQNLRLRAITTEPNYLRSKAVHDATGVWPERYVDIDEGRLLNLGRTMQAIDGMGVRPDNQSDKVNPVDASLDTARKYSRGR